MSWRRMTEPGDSGVGGCKLIVDAGASSAVFVATGVLVAVDTGVEDAGDDGAADRHPAVAVTINDSSNNMIAVVFIPNVVNEYLFPVRLVFNYKHDLMCCQPETQGNRFRDNSPYFSEMTKILN